MFALSRRLHLGTLLLVLAAAGVGCSSSDSAPAAPTNFSGQVLVPNNPQLAGAATGLLPVPGATVELIMVDDAGNPVGNVLATATADASGNYTIELPTGVTFGPNLIVRIAGGVADGLRAQVVSSTVDVDPSTEYVLRKLTSGGNSLTNVTLNEVLALQAVVNEFDLGVGDIESVINDLDADAAETIDPLVEAADDVAGDAAAVAGGYHYAQLSLEISTGQFSAHFVERGMLTLADRGGGDGAITNQMFNEFATELFASPNGLGGANYNLGFLADSGVEAGEIPFQAGTGMLLVLQPAVEDIEQATGFREPAGVHTLYPVSDAVNNMTYIGALATSETEYGLDQGAIDFDNVLNRFRTYTMLLTARKEALSNATLNGMTYGYIGFGELYEENGSREIFGDLGTFTFTQTTATTGTVAVTDDIISLFRTPVLIDTTATVEWGNTGPGGVDDPVGEDDGDAVQGYEIVTADGTIRWTGLDAGHEVEGFVSNGGRLIVLGDAEDLGTEAEDSLQVAVKLGTSNPDVSTNSYCVFAIGKLYTRGGASCISRINNSTLTVNGTDVSLAFPDRIWTRDHDLATAISLETGDAVENGTLSFEGSNGEASMLIEGSKLSGFFSADGSIGVFRFADSDFAEGDEASMALVILIRK